jgi:hypothetical protein
MLFSPIGIPIGFGLDLVLIERAAANYPSRHGSVEATVTRYNFQYFAMILAGHIKVSTAFISGDIHLKYKA